ncbi:MAG: hypothetical protein ABI954_11180 [Pyrinomonadaceae bacterium]
MGYIETSAALPVIYNVINAVGLNCPNHRDDVKLVQYLLLNRYKNVQPKGATPKGEMKVDGICGGVTINWINKFQIDIMFAHRSIMADKRVDRIRNAATLTGDISKTTYTLGWLNWLVAYFEPEAFAKLPLFVSLANPMEVPPPGIDIVVPAPPPEIMIPVTGGI